MIEAGDPPPSLLPPGLASKLITEFELQWAAGGLQA